MNVPRELLRSTPRSVELTGSGRVAVVLSFLLVVGAVVGGALIHESAIRSREQVSRRVGQAVAATGVVQSVKRRDGKWRMIYAFTVGGRGVTGQWVGRRVEAGTSVPIRFEESSPEDSWIEGHSPKPMPFWLAPLFGVALLVVAALIQMKLRQQRFLLENGRAAVAVAKASKKVHGETCTYATQYQYRTSSGGTADGQLDSERAIPVGSEFIVVFDSDQPKKLAEYPLALVRIAE